MQRVVRSALVGLTIAGLTACGDKVTVPPPVTTAADTSVHGITVTPPTLTLTVVAPGNTGTLVAAIDAGPGSPARTVTWTSSNTAAATVVGTGNTAVVTGRAAGQATISATVPGSPNVQGAAIVTVGAVAPSQAPTVTISTINTTVCGIGGCNSVPALLTNVNGQIDVTLNVEPNGQTLRSVSATITCPGSTPVTVTQTISGTVQADLAAEAAAVPVTLSFNTAAFNSTTGAVALRNGQCTISTQATTASGTQSAVVSTPFTLNNQDVAIINNTFAAITNAEGLTQPTTANDAFGLPWKAGSVTVQAIPVLYSGRTLSSISITLPGATNATQTITTTTNAPVSVTYTGALTATSGSRVTGLTLVDPVNLEVNGTTPKGITPTVIALDNAGNDLLLTIVPGTNATFRLDNTAPQAPLAFNIPSRQIGWVNAAYVPVSTGRGSSDGNLSATAGSENFVSCGDGPDVAADPHVCQPQVGVSASAQNTVGVGTGATNGNTTLTYYYLDTRNAATPYTPPSANNGTGTTATACDRTGWTKINTAADVPESFVNTAYVFRVFESDKLLNARCTDLSVPPAATANLGTTINTGATGRFTANQGRFGVDKVPPNVVYVEPSADATAAGDQQAIGVGQPIPNFKLAMSDNASGFGLTPVNVMLRRLAIDPATGAASTVNTSFGCPIGFGAQSSGVCGNSPRGATIAVDNGSNIDGYYFYNATVLDLARNTTTVTERKVVIDRVIPVVGGIAVPASITGGSTANFTTSATDNLDLISSNYTLSYPTAPAGSGASLNIRANGPDLGVAFDNVLTTSVSPITLNVANFVRSIATTTAAGAPQNNAVAPNQISVRAVDAVGNVSAPGTSPIQAANVPQTNRTDYTLPQANGATFTGTGFSVANTAANVSNCPAAGCAGGAAAANATSVTLTATAQGTEGPTFQFLNPFTAVQFYYFNTVTGEWTLIGSATGPTVTDNALQTIRTFQWALTTPFDPPAALGVGPLNIVAVGVNGSGDGLASANNVAITLTNP